jgi:carbohydrate-selective porin OprB
VAFRNGGWYATFEQLLVRAESPQRSGLTRPTVAAFVQLGASDPRVYQTTSHRGAGVALSEYSTHRTADTFGAGVTRVDWLHGHELVVELFYEARMSRHLSVVADQQWIRGADAGVRSARGAVTTIRSVIAF